MSLNRKEQTKLKWIATAPNRPQLATAPIKKKSLSSFVNFVNNPSSSAIGNCRFSSEPTACWAERENFSRRKFKDCRQASLTIMWLHFHSNELDLWADRQKYEHKFQSHQFVVFFRGIVNYFLFFLLSFFLYCSNFTICNSSNTQLLLFTLLFN